MPAANPASKLKQFLNARCAAGPRRPSRLVIFFVGGSAELPRSRERRIALVMLVLTLGYLIVELGFNARLLDVVGGLASHDEIESIEVFGRLISGTALALLMLGFQLQKGARRGWDAATYAVRVPLVAVTCISAMYFGQRALIDWLVDRSTADDRSRAAVLVPMTHLMTRENFTLTGLNLEAEAFRTPEGKTFLATFPLQALSVPDLSERLTRQAPIMFAIFAEKMRGGPDEFHRAFLESQRGLEKQYETKYLDADRKFNQETSGWKLTQRQAEAWRDYEDSLRRRNRRLRPDNVPRAHWPAVRKDLRAKGIQVSDSWAPSDRAGFNVAVARKVRQEGLATFRRDARTTLGIAHDLDPGLSFEQFLANPGIQLKWKDALQLPANVRLVKDQNAGTLERAVYEPTIEADAERLVRERMANPQEYADGGRFEEVGRDSYRSLIVPPIALLFSLAGAMTHIFKCGAFAFKSVRKVNPWLFKAALVGYLALAVAIPLRLTNQVSSQHLFQRLAEQTREGLGGIKGPLVAGGIRWTTQFQPIFYPVNEFVRTSILLGMTYGYEGGSARSAH